MLDKDPRGALADPHPMLLESYRGAASAYRTKRYGTVAARKEAYEMLWALEEDLAGTEPRTLQGALAQLEFAWDGIRENERIHDEQRRAMQAAIGLIRRLAQAS